MIQQVNLYYPIFRRQEKKFSAKAMLQAGVVVFGGIALLYALSWWRIEVLRAQASEVDQQQLAAAHRIADIGREFPPRAAKPKLVAQLRRLQERLARYGSGLDAFYYCPHAPEDGCVCRKPNPGLFQRAASDLGLDLGSSAIIGDRLLDVQAGERLGLLTAYVPEPGERLRYPDEVPLARASADICAPTFFEAALRVMARG